MTKKQKSVFQLINDIYKSGKVSNTSEPVSPRTKAGRKFVNVHKLKSRRCYRVLVPDCNSPPVSPCSKARKMMSDYQGRHYQCSRATINSNSLVFPSEQEALAEKSMTNRSKVRPLLVAFECWGKCYRINGGGPSLRFEHVKFMGVIKTLAPPDSVSIQHCKVPVAPHFFPASSSPSKHPFKVVKIDINPPKGVPARGRSLLGRKRSPKVQPTFASVGL